MEAHAPRSRVTLFRVESRLLASNLGGRRDEEPDDHVAGRRSPLAAHQAAEDDRSASRWVAELIERTRRQQDDYDVAMQRYLAMQPRKIEWPEGRKPTREELYDRPGVR